MWDPLKNNGLVLLSNHLRFFLLRCSRVSWQQHWVGNRLWKIVPCFNAFHYRSWRFWHYSKHADWSLKMMLIMGLSCRLFVNFHGRGKWDKLLIFVVLWFLFEAFLQLLSLIYLNCYAFSLKNLWFRQWDVRLLLA